MSNLLLDTRYSADKIVWLKEGTTTTSEYGSWNISIDHNIGSIIFVKGVWSYDNWATILPIGVSIYEGSVAVSRSSAISTSSSIAFSGIHRESNKVIRYRLWAVAYDSANISINETASVSRNRYILDTRTNLPRLYSETYLNSGSTYNHNLGRIPYCDVWSTFDNNQFTYLSIDMFGTNYGIGEFLKITSSQIIATGNNGSPTKFYIRVYND